MRFYNIPAIFASMLFFAACSDSHEPARGSDEEQVYSFTAILDSGKSRLGYQEDSNSHNLKMVWDEGDVIRLYPDDSMDDPNEYYEFVANTGTGTSHTVFVHQGYILNWEHWKGKAIYAFPGKDNLDVKDDSEEFLAKAYVQKANDNTEHLKYAEFKPTADGKKSYTGYWSAFLDDANLKMDHQMTFEHKNTVVYKIMLRGFLFDIPGGSQLQMSGDAWPEGEVTCLTLGDKDDEEPFLKVGQYGKAGYEDKVLTAYIIRQTKGDKDGDIKEGGKVKFRLLCYDELDGLVIKLDLKDEDKHRRTDQDPEGKTYFTNIPWGDEYTWEVEVAGGKEYLAGDYVVADLTDTSKKYSNPVTVAIDLGLPVKWAAFNLGADRPDQYGYYYLWGNSTYEHKDYYYNVLQYAEPANEEWKKGDPDYDAAARIWGGGWRMPEYTEMRDFIQYTDIVDGKGNKAANKEETMWISNYTGQEIFKQLSKEFIQKHVDKEGNEVLFLEIASKVNDRYIYMPLAGYVSKSGHNRLYEWGVFLSSTKNKVSNRVLTLLFRLDEIGNEVRGNAHSFAAASNCRVFSLRAVKE
ncbi:MAG: hypothetical protein NC248_06375 [Bacteroides sp.]|nr:hypothetical protein [Bacteroides sp.]MCM1389250.1 hypothetical protein [Bacteroides sp.]